MISTNKSVLAEYIMPYIIEYFSWGVVSGGLLVQASAQSRATLDESCLEGLSHWTSEHVSEDGGCAASLSNHFVFECPHCE